VLCVCWRMIVCLAVVVLVCFCDIVWLCVFVFGCTGSLSLCVGFLLLW